MKEFKIRASASNTIMGRMGLTEAQECKLLELQNKPKARTELQEKEMQSLLFKKANPELPDTCTSFLKSWYAEQYYGVKDMAHSKYFDKGNWCEREAIDIIAERLGLGILDKNTEQFEDEYFTGTPDVICSIIIDAKNSWDGETFLKALTSPVDQDYCSQLKVYCHLTKLKEAKLCYLLLDTPEECNYGNEVVYSHNGISKRFFSLDVKEDPTWIELVIERVKLCRVWLEKYDKEVKSLLINSNCK